MCKEKYPNKWINTFYFRRKEKKGKNRQEIFNAVFWSAVWGRKHPIGQHATSTNCHQSFWGKQHTRKGVPAISHAKIKKTRDIYFVSVRIYVGASRRKKQEALTSRDRGPLKLIRLALAGTGRGDGTFPWSNRKITTVFCIQKRRPKSGRIYVDRLYWKAHNLSFLTIPF